MSREAAGHTLQPTALVHEAWLNLVGSGTIHSQDEGHFLAKAAEAMRCILIDRARRKASIRHGGGHRRIDFDEVSAAADTPPETLLRINDALEKLAAESKSKAELVKLRFFAGLSREEAASALGVSLATADRWWAFARAWLMVELQRP
jgi:RNA polymerase sigma factor (TIGR02999 family)